MRTPAVYFLAIVFAVLFSAVQTSRAEALDGSSPLQPSLVTPAEALDISSLLPSYYDEFGYSDRTRSWGGLTVTSLGILVPSPGGWVVEDESSGTEDKAAYADFLDYPASAALCFDFVSAKDVVDITGQFELAMYSAKKGKTSEGTSFELNPGSFVVMSFAGGAQYALQLTASMEISFGASLKMSYWPALKAKDSSGSTEFTEESLVFSIPLAVNLLLASSNARGGFFCGLEYDIGLNSAKLDLGGGYDDKSDPYGPLVIKFGYAIKK